MDVGRKTSREPVGSPQLETSRACSPETNPSNAFLPMNTKACLARPARPVLPLAIAMLAATAHAQHLHLNVGAASLAQGSSLAFINGSSLNIQSGWFLPMPFQTNGLHNGLYRASSLTLTVLPATPDFGGPDPWHALWGARIVAQVESLQGPQGGHVAFWDSDGVAEDTEPRFTIPVGTTNGTWRFNLSENDGSVGSDPYGHIHGRYFTTTTPGLYVLGLRAIDVSTSGPGGGPWNSPSSVIQLYLQAGSTLDYFLDPKFLSRGSAFVRYAMEKDRRYFLLTS